MKVLKYVADQKVFVRKDDLQKGHHVFRLGFLHD